MTHSPSNHYLSGRNAAREDVDQPWEQDNQAWWDWYVSLGSDDLDTAVLRDASHVQKVNDTLTESLEAVEPAGDDDLARELDTRYPLTDAQREFFETQGFIKLPGVLSARAVARLRAEMRRLFVAEFGADPDLEASDRFLSIEMAWLEHPVMERFIRSSRIGGLSAELLGVDAVRLYHDNLLAKQPGCGRTPWHYDRHHFPIATDDIVTAWIPAQLIPPEMGPLAFAGPIDAFRLVENVPFDKFGTSYDQRVDRLLRSADKVDIHAEPFAVGDVSFHHNLCFHSAPGNATRFSRMALANTFFADGARVVDRPTMVSGDWQKFMPGIKPGAIIDTRLNPICGH